MLPALAYELGEGGCISLELQKNRTNISRRILKNGCNFLILLKFFLGKDSSVSVEKNILWNSGLKTIHDVTVRPGIERGLYKIKFLCVD